MSQILRDVGRMIQLVKLHETSDPGCLAGLYREQFAAVGAGKILGNLPSVPHSAGAKTAGGGRQRDWQAPPCLPPPPGKRAPTQRAGWGQAPQSGGRGHYPSKAGLTAAIGGPNIWGYPAARLHVPPAWRTHPRTEGSMPSGTPGSWPRWGQCQSGKKLWTWTMVTVAAPWECGECH